MHSERADVAAADVARKALADFLRLQARTIRDKYIEPPATTDFAILFLPTEGLYAEMMARPGFTDSIQREYRVLLTGPTNLAALLNSLQMGFRTLAIEQRSSEVWRVLGAVKTEFARFGDALAQTKDRIDKASEELERVGVRRRALERPVALGRRAARARCREAARGRGRAAGRKVAGRRMFEAIRKWRERRVLRSLGAARRPVARSGECAAVPRDLLRRRVGAAPPEGGACS